MFEWNDDYKVGVKVIDQQHQKLFSLLHELHQAATQGKARTVVAQVLEGVVNYTKEHFGTEESLMKQHGYPEFTAHKQMHDGLVRQALDLVEKSKVSALTVSLDVMRFLESWIAHHISDADRKLGRFLTQKGLP